jgi:hypothetical protein
MSTGGHGRQTMCARQRVADETCVRTTSFVKDPRPRRSAGARRLEGRPYRLIGDVRRDGDGVLRARVGPRHVIAGRRRRGHVARHALRGRCSRGLTVTPHDPDPTTTAYGMFADFVTLDRSKRAPVA